MWRQRPRHLKGIQRTDETSDKRVCRLVIPRRFMKLPIMDTEMKATLLKEYDVALVSGTIRVYSIPSWPCHDKRDMSVQHEIYLDTANGTRYRLVEETND
jgi:hypothetical protein